LIFKKLQKLEFSLKDIDVEHGHIFRLLNVARSLKAEFLAEKTDRVIIDPILTEFENIEDAVIKKQLPTNESAIDFLRLNGITILPANVSSAQTAFKGTQSSHYLIADDIFNEGPLLHNFQSHGLTRTGLNEMRRRNISKDAMRKMYTHGTKPTDADLNN
jgi:hypothetical protein